METSTRRTALKRGLTVAAGAIGLTGVRHASAGAVTAPAPTALTLEGRNVRAQADRAVDEPIRLGDRLTVSADLVEPGTGRKVGEYFATRIATTTPGASARPLVLALETHVFQFTDGSTILGSGAALAGAAANQFAVTGGTARFAGALGSYVARTDALDLGGDGTATFTFTLTTRASDGV